MRSYDDSGQYSEYEITSVCGVSGGKQPYLVTKQGGSSALEGVKRGTTYVALSAIDVDGGLVRENGLTQYEGSLVHRALHYRKAPKRKSKRTQSLGEQPTGMAAGVLGVRRCNRSVVCDAITVKGEKITKSPAQLFATYDVKGPIKGRTRRQRVRKNRTLRVLGPVQTPEREAAECIDATHGNDMQTPATALATPSGARSDLHIVYGLRTIESQVPQAEGKNRSKDLDELEDVIARARRVLNHTAGVSRARPVRATGTGGNPRATPPRGNPLDDAIEMRRGRGEGGGDGSGHEGSSSRFPRRGHPR